ncbi:MAG: hypothetical protein HQL41_01520 [Alphaproteobacteria bacterium]|nr:hypothetical protein [Alphaproteobacteria bacterium]
MIVCAVPVHDNRDDAWDTIYLRPRLDRPEGAIEDEALLGLGWEERQRNVKAVTRTMLDVVEAGFDTAYRLIEAGEAQTKVIVPLFGAAFVDKSVASAFTEACKAQPPDVHRRIVFEVTGVGDEVAMSWLDDVAIVLHLFCLSYTCRVTPRSRNFTFHATCNYSGVSLDLANKPWPVDRVGPFLVDFVAKCKIARLRAYVHGVGSAELAAAAIEAGVRFMDGSAVRP